MEKSLAIDDISLEANSKKEVLQYLQMEKEYMPLILNTNNNTSKTL